MRHHCQIAGRSNTLFLENSINVSHNASRGHPRAADNRALPALAAAFAADHAIVDEKATYSPYMGADGIETQTAGV